MPIPLLLANPSGAAKVAVGLNTSFQLLAERFWPGELTLIIKRKSTVPDIVTAGGDTVALRMPDNPVALQICREMGGVLAVTSANLSGEPACVTAQEVLHSLDGRIPLILDGGRSRGGVASTIIDCVAQPPHVLRLGRLTLELLHSIEPTITA